MARKKKNGGGGAAVAEMPADTKPANSTTMLVPIAALEFDNKGDRLDELLDKDRIAELARSMAGGGQLHPIGVVGGEDESYRVVYGRRRIEAAKLLGWKEINASVLTFESEADLLSAREIENVQRQDLNPLEEALAVANLIDLERAQVLVEMQWPAESLTTEQARVVRLDVEKRVAVRLAKSLTWVRDRAFLAKLEGKARAAVLEGRLPLGHAREIAKLADPNLRDEFAEMYAADKRYDKPPEDIDDVREAVAKRLFSLAQVPWKLDVPFAGAPACVECPHNSANNPGLFEHSTGFATDQKDAKAYRLPSGRKEPDAGVCTLHECFGKKSAAANKAVSAASSRVAKKVKEAPKKERASTLKELKAGAAPDFIRPAVVAQQIEAKLKPAKPAASRASLRQSYKPKPPTPEFLAAGELAEALQAECRKIEPMLAAKLKKTPGLWTLYTLLRKTKAYEATHHHDPKKQAKAVASPELAALMRLLAKPGWEAVVELEKHCGTMYGLLNPWQDGRSGMARQLAAALGVDLEPAPTLEDFLPKSEKGVATRARAPADLGADYAAKLANGFSSAELHTKNKAKLAEIAGEKWVIVGSCSRGKHELELEAYRIRAPRPGEDGLTYNELLELWDEGKRGRGDSSGQLVMVGKTPYILSEGWVWSRKDETVSSLKAKRAKHDTEPGKDDEAADEIEDVRVAEES